MQVFEGTLDEIVSKYGAELTGKVLRVSVKESIIAPRPFHETATKEEFSKEFRRWVSTFNPNIPPLSDEAMERESIYEGRGD